MLAHSEPIQEQTIPRTPLIDPADWRGPDIAHRSDWIYSLEEGDVTELDAALHNIERAAPDLVSATKDDFLLRKVREKLEAVRHQLDDGLGLALIRGLPVDRYTRKQVATIYWGIGLHFGKPALQNSKGHVLGHVINLGHTMANHSKRARNKRDAALSHRRV
ncbi:hypothetical protein ACVWW4_000062 [Bradyrhizobium sp. LB7.1]